MQYAAKRYIYVGSYTRREHVTAKVVTTCYGNQCRRVTTKEVQYTGRSKIRVINQCHLLLIHRFFFPSLIRTSMNPLKRSLTSPHLHT